MITKEEGTMTRPLKIIFLLLWAAALILATATAIRAKGSQQLPSPPTIRSVSPNADGSVDIAVESCNNMLPEGGTTPYSLLEYYPRRGPTAPTGPDNAQFGNVWTVPNQLLSVIFVNPGTNTTTYRISLQLADVVENAQMGDQVSFMLTCAGPDGESSPSNPVTITVGDPSSGYPSSGEPTPTPAPAPTPTPTPI